MTTIEERYDKYKFYSNPHLAAIESATEQREIDKKEFVEWLKENFYEWSGYYQGEDFVVHNSCETITEMCKQFLEDMED